ncbi:MAG: FHA domain-containing protein [Planctomycetota bacterium]|nr:MAG: FHA domain-containing protein [Planctomycetota bacterium]
MTELVLVGLWGTEEGREYRIKENNSLILGRSGKADISLRDPKLSREHCEFAVTDIGATLRDMGSKNGTFVNKKRIIEHNLKTGDLVTLGKNIFLATITTEEPKTKFPRRVLGSYRLIERLGAGGMGTVYLAEHVRDKKRYAIKVLSPNASSNPSFLERFYREGRAGEVLNHPNIVKIYDTTRNEQYHYMVMEYVQGENLDQKIEREKMLPVELVIDIGRQASSALAHAYDNQIIHRDIKPENIVLTKSGLCKITDFGLVKLLDSSTHMALTQTGEGMGTLAYLPPEQIWDAKNADTRADIYGLGASLYHLLCGRPPFDADFLSDFFKKIREDEPRPPREFNTTVSQKFSKILLTMLAKDPAHRYQTPHDVVASLEEVRKEYGV